MATNQNVETPEVMESIGEAMSKTELFFENNGKKLSCAIFALVAVAAAIFGYKVLVVEPQMEKASAMLSNGQLIFEQENPDFNAALNGDENGVGFLEVIEKYGSTPAGNLANHYAGICYLKSGDLENAAKYLAQYDAMDGIPASLINAQNLGLQGDVAVDMGDLAKGATFYNSAISASDNVLTAPTYMRKAAIVAIEMGENAKAKELFETILAKYPASAEVRDAEKYLGTIK